MANGEVDRDQKRGITTMVVEDVTTMGKKNCRKRMKMTCIGILMENRLLWWNNLMDKYLVLLWFWVRGNRFLIRVVLFI